MICFIWTILSEKFVCFEIMIYWFRTILSEYFVSNVICFTRTISSEYFVCIHPCYVSLRQFHPSSLYAIQPWYFPLGQFYPNTLYAMQAWFVLLRQFYLNALYVFKLDGFLSDNFIRVANMVFNLTCFTRTVPFEFFCMLFSCDMFECFCIFIYTHICLYILLLNINKLLLKADLYLVVLFSVVSAIYFIIIMRCLKKIQKLRWKLHWR